MFQQAINEKIKNVNLLQKEDLPLFRELKNKYPYTEIFHLIHLQLIKKYDPISFEEELGSVAYKIRDRYKLVDLLQEPEISVIEEEYETPILAQTIEVVEIQEENVTELENKQSEIPIPVEEIDVTEHIDVDTTNLNTQIAAEAFSTIFSKDFEPTIQFQLEDDLVEEDNSTHTPKKEETVITTDNSQKSFISWLKSSKKEEKLDKNQLIDTIIATNPTISRPKKEFYSPSKQAIKSVDDEKLVYTETLAKILEMQGNFSK
ncbi:MAG: hypothetical protein RL728_359, partial [Bacteroidota bacterium]